MTVGKNKNEKNRNVSYFELFRYATWWDICLIIVAIVMCSIKAAMQPLSTICYSELVSMFIERNMGSGSNSKTIVLPIFGGGALLINATHEENMAALRKDSMSFGIIMSIVSLTMFISGIIHVDVLNHVALKQVIRMRRKFFESTLRQDIGWHDIAEDQNFAVRITENMEKIRDGISEKLGHFIFMMITMVVSVTISFIYGWKLSLAVSAYIPISLICNYVVAKYQSKFTIKEQNAYVKAGSVAEEVIGGIRTVVAFEGEAIESKRYDRMLIPARKAGKWRGAVSGLGDAIFRSMLFLSSSLAIWYGTHLILNDRDKDPDDKEYTPAVLMIAFFGILIGADNISKTTPFLEAFAMARGSAAAIFDVIDSTSNIDPMSTDGKIMNYGLKGNIEFQDIFFQYPSRAEVVVLRNFNLSIKEGQTVALVGYSGSGKSTCVQLLQRFYDPIFGKIVLDGIDIKQYNVQWLRSNMAVVGQEPVLFQGTIGENIRYGKCDASQKELEDSARAAGAHDFIIGLPDGYKTLISEKGIQLSGGQRQRIAIARALIQNPKILLLDEATSALDYQSEKLVQEALDKASKGRTTIVVSHRLSAVRHADRIAFIDHGKVVEEGTHEELMELNGKYSKMVTASEYVGNEDIHDSEKGNADNLKARKISIDAGNKTNLNLYGDTRGRLSEVSIGKNAARILSIKKESDEQKETKYFRTFMRILRVARPQWCYIFVGAVCAAIFGCTQPAFAFIYSEFYAALATADPEVVRQRVGLISLICFGVGITVGVVCFIQTYLFNVAGICLTTRLRSETFRSAISQETAWFDEEENSVGALSARISGDGSGVQGAIGLPLSGIIQAFTNFLCSMSLSLYYSWNLALICLCTSPIMVGSVIFEAKFITKSAVREKEILEETSRIATETIAQIRTVAGLRREAKAIEEYNKEVERYRRQIKRRLRFRGVVNSLGISIMMFGYGLTLWYGGILNSEGKIKFQDIMKVSETLLYGLLILGQALAFTPAFTTALIAGHRLFNIIDRKSRIVSPPQQRVNVSKANNNNGVTYRDVYFRYPTRPTVQVLNKLNLNIFHGKTVALVGSSGCGKSTCLQLLQRYYDSEAGAILIDQDDIQRDIDLPTLRRRLGIVSQEPSLFEKTISENIAYGDTSREVPMSQIIEAAKMSNAHDFITALPSGYDTCLGAKGTQLSGGQKQRIAIARALVRNPKILLLDEATSALDLQSERIVQTALDEACSGRTCIVIAHRLSTIQNADLICVLQNGQVVEQGTHPQLLAKNGIYSKLHKSQPNAQ